MATENEILSRLTKESNKKGVVLTYTHKLFFLRLLKYAGVAGESLDDGFSLSLSVKELSEVLEIPFRTTVQCLNRLSACGAIQRTEAIKTFPRSPSKTLVCKNFYEKEK